MNYDAIVIGAGNGGLVSALKLQKEGKKVLLLESHNTVGGVATSFIRGRFEFEASLHELCAFGNENNVGEIYKLFKDLDILDKIKMNEIDETFHVITLDTKEEYTMPVGVSNFINKMEEYVPESRKSMEKFFELCKENQEALNYLNESKGNVDAKVLKSKYHDFMIYASYPLEDVLESIKMPKKAREILSTYWTYLGSPATELSFVHYASMIYSYVNLHPVISSKKSHELSLALYEKFLSLGGDAKLLTTVNKIIVDDNKVKGVVTSDGKTYYAKVVIANVSPNLVYGKLIDIEDVPIKARQLTNARILGARGICVYLGLNKSPEELGLKNYSYFIYHTLDSRKEFERMKKLKNDNMVGVVINNAVPDASPKGTTMLYLTGLLFSDIFTKVVTKDNYFDLKDAISENFIETFEKATGVNIHDAIEEIEVATPLTFARYTNHPDGVIYGYLAKKSDNLLPRMMNQNNEDYVEGLYFAGGFASRLSGYSSTYKSGEMAALKALAKLNKKEVAKDEV